MAASELAGGNDLRPLVLFERKQSTFVTGYQIVRCAGLRERQQEVVVRIRRATDLREIPDVHREFLNLIDEAAGFIGLDEGSDARLSQRGPHFGDVLRAGKSVNRSDSQAL